MFAALLIGLLGSLHCIGMCGPLAMAMPFSRPDGRISVSRTLAYHSGRIATYATLGLAMGLIGGGLRYFFVQQWISIASGVLLLLVYFLPKALNAEAMTSISAAWNRKVVMRLRRMLQPAGEGPAVQRLFGLGVLNGLLPCGLVYMALIGAVGQPTVAGATAFMIIFGIGTSPALSAIIFANKLVTGKLRASYSRIIPVFVVAVSTLLILRGMGLGIPYISPADERHCCHGPQAVVIDHRACPELTDASQSTLYHDQLQDPTAVPV